MLQPVLSGYVGVGREIEAVARRVRHRMGDVARRGYWRRLLNHYMRLPDSVRAFDRTDNPDRRVIDKTVFAPRPSSLCPNRDETYAAALADPLAYRKTGHGQQAEAGKQYLFPVKGGFELVHLPGHLPEAGPVRALGTVAERVRQPWRVSLDEDLSRAAKEIDALLANRPDIRNRDWVRRLGKLRLSLADPESGELRAGARELTIDGVEHVVGLMNSGKTTLTDLITVDGVLFRGKRVCQVVSSVGDVYAKVSFLRSLGIDAVPLIGRSSRGEHAARYWRTMVEEAAALIPDGVTPPDPAAAYANASCLLEPYRQVMRPDWEPLAVQDFPCRGRLREVGAEAPRPCDCPLLAVCPAQKALRDVADAQVWVTTPQALVGTKADPAEADVRWLEQVQHDMDLLILDEADAVQQVLDDRFVQEENLVSGEDGWTHRMVDYANKAMARMRIAQASDPQVQQWYELQLIHQQAVFALYRLALSEGGEALRDLLGGGTFTAHSLFREAARMLFGLPRHGDGDKAVEDMAEDFYQRQLQDFAEEPVGNQAHPLQPVVASLTVIPRDEGAVHAALDEWIDANAAADAREAGAIDRDRSAAAAGHRGGCLGGPDHLHVLRDDDDVPVRARAAPAPRRGEILARPASAGLRGPGAGGADGQHPRAALDARHGRRRVAATAVGSRNRPLAPPSRPRPAGLRGNRRAARHPHVRDELDPGLVLLPHPGPADRRARAGRGGPPGAGEVRDGSPADEGRRQPGPDLRFRAVRGRTGMTRSGRW